MNRILTSEFLSKHFLIQIWAEESPAGLGVKQMKILIWLWIGIMSVASASLPVPFNIPWALVLFAGGAYGFALMAPVPYWYWHDFVYANNRFADALREGFHSPAQGGVLLVAAGISLALGLPGLALWLAIYGLAQLAGWSLWYFKVYRKAQKLDKRKKK